MSGIYTGICQVYLGICQLYPGICQELILCFVVAVNYTLVRDPAVFYRKTHPEFINKAPYDLSSIQVGSYTILNNSNLIYVIARFNNSKQNNSYFFCYCINAHIHQPVFSDR